jgi:Ca2+-dependent lipid-binding protein
LVLTERQPIKTDPSQSLEDYKYNQDVTAPPDPVAEGTTTDVPIHGEKTNVLFHPTPSVSYEPMFAALEKRANILCAGILISTVVIGKIFGGALKGLIPLGMFLASGVYLWMKEVVRSGREFEWDGEQVRGQMVCTDASNTKYVLINVCAGFSKLATRICRVDEHASGYRLGSHQPRHVPRRCRHA